MSDDRDNSGMKYIGGLWKSKTKSGQNMLSGNIGRHIKIVILPNKNKQAGDKKPDVNLFIAEPERREDDDSSAPPLDNDIPF
jgi:hypothetical protein